MREPELRTRSELEDRFRALLLAADLPEPELNATLELNATTIEVDCLWRPHKVIVELDGYEFHGTRTAYERDRERDRRLAAAGWRAVRITWLQLTHDGDAVIADLQSLLGQ
jgi:very-short-patch-repair endonuclease